MKADFPNSTLGAGTAHRPQGTARTPMRAPAIDLALPASAAPAPLPSAPDAAEARRFAAEANRKLAESNQELTIEFDDELGRMIFRIVDTHTREVVRQVPSDAVIAIARALSTALPPGMLIHTDA